MASRSPDRPASDTRPRPRLERVLSDFNQLLCAEAKTAREIREAFRDEIPALCTEFLSKQEDDAPALFRIAVEKPLCLWKTGEGSVDRVIVVWRREDTSVLEYEVYTKRLADSHFTLDVRPEVDPLGLVAIEYHCGPAGWFIQPRKYQQRRITQSLHVEPPLLDTPIAIKSECLVRIRRWHEANRFIWSVLGIQPFPPTLHDAEVSLEPNLDRRSQLLGADVSTKQRKAGFKIESTPVEGDFPESIAIDPELNRQLFSLKISGKHSKNAALLVTSALEAATPSAREALCLAAKQVYLNAVRDDAPLMKAELKLCLADDISKQTATVGVYPASFYATALTSDLVSRRVRQRGRIIHEGAFVSAFAADEKSRKWCLKDIRGASICHRVGASTLLVTNDWRIPIWLQLPKQRSESRLVPSASGSCDWDDWVKAKPSFTGAIRETIRRELLEECSLSELTPPPNIDTCILGYFRWTLLGGKPDFIAISKIDVPSTMIRPNPNEVTDIGLWLDASSEEAFQHSVTDVLDRCGVDLPKLSVPLFACLDELLDRACYRPDQRVRRFIWPHQYGDRALVVEERPAFAKERQTKEQR